MKLPLQTLSTAWPRNWLRHVSFFNCLTGCVAESSQSSSVSSALYITIYNHIILTYLYLNFNILKTSENLAVFVAIAINYLLIQLY